MSTARRLFLDEQARRYPIRLYILALTIVRAIKTLLNTICRHVTCAEHKRRKTTILENIEKQGRLMAFQSNVIVFTS